MNGLTTKEQLVLRFILEEKSANEIAHYLQEPLATVDDIRKSIYKKLDAKSPIGLAKKAFTLGLFNEDNKIHGV